MSESYSAANVNEKTTQHFLCITLSEAAKSQVNKALSFYLKCLKHSEVVTTENYSDVRAITPASQLVVAQLKNESSARLMNKETRSIPFGTSYSRVLSSGVKLRKHFNIVGLDMKLDGPAVTELESSLTSANILPPEIGCYLFCPLFQASSKALAENIFDILTSQYQQLCWYWSTSELTIRKGEFNTGIVSIYVNTGTVLKPFQDFSIWVPVESEDELDVAVAHTLGHCVLSCCTDDDRQQMDFTEKLKYFCGLKSLPIQLGSGFIKHTFKYGFSDNNIGILPEDINVISVNSNMGSLIDTPDDKVFKTAYKQVLEQDRLTQYLKHLEDKKKDEVKTPLANIATEKKAYSGINTRVTSALTQDEIDFFRKSYTDNIAQDKMSINTNDAALAITEKVNEMSVTDKRKQSDVNFHTADSSFNIDLSAPLHQGFLDSQFRKVMHSTLKDIPEVNQSQIHGVRGEGEKVGITPQQNKLQPRVRASEAANDGSPFLENRNASISGSSSTPSSVSTSASTNIELVKKNLAIGGLTDVPPATTSSTTGTATVPATTLPIVISSIADPAASVPSTSE